MADVPVTKLDLEEALGKLKENYDGLLRAQGDRIRELEDRVSRDLATKEALHKLEDEVDDNTSKVASASAEIDELRGKLEGHHKTLLQAGKNHKALADEVAQVKKATKKTAGKLNDSQRARELHDAHSPSSSGGMSPRSPLGTEGGASMQCSSVPMGYAIIPPPYAAASVSQLMGPPTAAWGPAQTSGVAFVGALGGTYPTPSAAVLAAPSPQAQNGTPFPMPDHGAHTGVPQLPTGRGGMRAEGVRWSTAGR